MTTSFLHAAKKRPSPRSRRRTLLHEVLEHRYTLTAPAFTPLAGDWDGDGSDSLGLFDPGSGQFFLRDINAPGFPHRAVKPVIVPGGSMPIVGDWNGNGQDTPGLFDVTGKRFLLFEGNGQLFREQAVDAVFAGAMPIAGDFDGDGRDDVGLYNPGNHSLRLLTTSSPTVMTFSDLPAVNALELLTGDFDGDQRDDVALLDRSTGLLHIAGAGTRVTTIPDDPAATVVIAGDWGGEGSARLGWYAPASGLFTPWYAWGSDPLAASLYAVPSARVQSHVDLPTTAAWQNPRDALDVNRDGAMSPLDAALVLNAINDLGSRALPAFRGNHTESLGQLDTSGDGILSPLDVLLVINALNARTLAPQGGGPMMMMAGHQLSASEVETLLDRASAASNTNDAIIAIVDRNGRILGVRAESAVLAAFAGDPQGLTFAIDGAIAKARTAAFFSNNSAPLTSRTVRFISQSTVTQREVQSNPNVGDFTSTVQGPGFVAPIGVGGHFPPGVNFTPPVDLFAIEHTNRDSLLHPGVDGIKGTADDLLLPTRFNVNPAFIPMGQEIEAPESYGYTSGQFIEAQSRGIATLPGGIPLYRDTDGNGVGDYLIGGIGVFFPGPDGYATHEQGFVAGIGQSELARTNAARVLEAEWIAFATAGGIVDSEFPGARIDTINGVPRPEGLRLPFGRIDLVGITLEIFGPHPTAQNPTRGIDRLLQVGASVLPGGVSVGADQPVTAGANGIPGDADDEFAREGLPVPEGWLVLPHAGGSLSAAEVEQIIMQGVTEANLVRAAIRLPIGSRTRMVFSVADLDGNVLGLYRMPDATVFSLDVAVAKARNMSYYADASAILPIDRVDDNRDGVPDPNVPAGVAMTARTFRFLAEPRYPAGIDGTTPGAFSILRDPGINPATAENIGGPLPASAYTSVLGFDAFHVGRNFRDPGDAMNGVANQNGVVFFPGSTPLYEGNSLVGGLGVSGDGVDQDDVVTWSASVGYQTPVALRADQYFVRGVRLPFQKFLRNPRG